MGARGPVPAPTRIKLLRGETRPSRVNYTEPLPPSGMPRMPADMSDEAKRVWRRVARDSARGVVRAINADTLRCYCEAVASYCAAARMYAATGPLIKTRNGPVKNPLHQIVREEREAVRLYAREFGFTPSAQAGLHVEPERAIDQVEHDIGLPPRLRAVGDDG